MLPAALVFVNKPPLMVMFPLALKVPPSTVIVPLGLIVVAPVPVVKTPPASTVICWGIRRLHSPTVRVAPL